jgi:hypothetical protein
MARQSARDLARAGLARVPVPATTVAVLPVGTSRLRVAATVVKTFSKPRWLFAHLICIAVAAGMVWLGFWQLDVSNEKHFDLQNFGYAIQWWAFSAASLFLWFRLMRDAWSPKIVTEHVTVALSRLHQPGAPLTTGQDTPGLALLASVEDGEAPVVYRGYVIPSSSTYLVRSDGDGYQDSYNDYLWKLNQADERQGSTQAQPAIVEARPPNLPPAER